MVNLLLVASANGGNGSSSLSDFVGSNPTVCTKLRQIMKKALVLLFMVSNAWAVETPYDQFTNEKNFTDTTTITWRAVDNVKESCNAEAVRKGYKEFHIGNKNMDACSFRERVDNKDTCVIITAKTTNYWNIGHEVRHCFQGKFHE